MIIPPTRKGITMKTLYFEGAGCVPRGDVENCRIRAAFKNDKGQRFYLELTGIEVNEKSPERNKKYTNVGFVDFCYELGQDGEKLRFDIEKQNYEYSKAGILEFVNTELGCSFEEVKAVDVFYEYHVHKAGGGYNFIEDHTFDSDKAYRARVAFAILDTKIRRQLNEEYSKISLASIGEDSITVRCYASDKSMREHGLDPDNRFITMNF